MRLPFDKPNDVPVILSATIALLLFGCGNDAQITKYVQVAVSEAISHAPAEFQTPLANYIDAAAKGVYSIDGTPTVQELTNKVLAFIPKDAQDKYPLITTTITTTISLAYQTYGKAGLTAIGKGLEAGGSALDYQMKIFGFDTTDPAGLQAALKAAETNIEQMRSVVAESENRIMGIIATAFAQLNGATLTLQLTPIPRAKPVTPDEGK